MASNNQFWPQLPLLIGELLRDRSSRPDAPNCCPAQPFGRLLSGHRHFALLSGAFDRANARLGLFISAHPLWHVLVSLTVVFALTIHLINMNIEYDIRRSFSPENSQAQREADIYKEYYNLTTSPQRAFILFTAKDGGTMLREKQLREVFKLDAEISGQMMIRDSSTGMRGCDPLCQLNRPFHLVANFLLNARNGSSKGHLELDYPVSRFLGSPLFVGINLFGTQQIAGEFMRKNRVNAKQLDAEQSAKHATDSSSAESDLALLATAKNSTAGHLFVRSIILWYFNRADTVETRERLRNVTLKLFKEAQEGNRLDHVNFKIFGDEIANTEMIRGAIQATLLMSIGLLLLLLFVTFVVRSKLGTLVSGPAVLCIVLVSVLCPLLSSLAAFGLNTWFGNRTYTMMCVTPFLIAGVGVDDAFIMLQSWQQHRTVGCVRQRLSLVLVHIGPSITITSLTNTVAFGIGFFTPTPQMSLFCLCTSIAVFIDFILTFTLLAPVLVLLSAHCPAKALSEITKPALPSSTETYQLAAPPPWILRYANFLHSRKGQISAVLLAILLYIVGTSGVLRQVLSDNWLPIPLFLKSTFEPSKAFPSDSPLAHSISSVREVFDEFFPISIIVNSPPNISDSVDYAEFNGMVAELEQLPESWGPSRTLLWLRSYEQFDRKNSEFWKSLGFGHRKEHALSLDSLDFFMAQLGNPPTVKMEKDSDGKTQLKAFQFSVVARGMTEWWNRAVAEERVREVLARHSRFNATMHDADAPILNMLLTVKQDLIGSIAVTIVCMAIICSLFISRPAGVIAIAASISSICFTLVGVISWCGADLDPVTMVDVLLATGFSVDYTAHVAHQYYTKRGSSVERIAHSLDEMCPPMLQAGISTVLCMLPLVFVPTYAIVAFAKTIFAVVSIGLLHGLFFLPALLCALPENEAEKRPSDDIKLEANGNEAAEQAHLTDAG